MFQIPALVALTATVVGAVPSLKVKGSNLINEDTGKRFQIVGVAYQPGGSAGYDPKLGKDPLSHGDTCMRDAALMQIQGVNAIRVYNLDPDINHDLCASIFNAVRRPHWSSNPPSPILLLLLWLAMADCLSLEMVCSPPKRLVLT